MLRKLSRSSSLWQTAIRQLAALPLEAEKSTLPRTYQALQVPVKKWRPSRTVRKSPPEFAQGQVLCTLSHKDLKSLVNQAVDALKKATQWQEGELTSGAMMHCLQSAAASRKKAFQLVQGQMLLVPKQNRLVTFATEGFMGKVAAETPNKEWTFLRNQEVMYDDKNCLVHHLTGYRVSERGLQEKDYLAETPGPPKSPTSYQAFLKKDYVHCVPDWVMAVVLQSNEVPKRTNNQKFPKKRPSRHSKFDVPGRMRETLERAGVPWFWLHNAWEGRLQVFQNSAPHTQNGCLQLVEEYSLEDEEFSKSWRAPPFLTSAYDLRSVLGYRANRRAYA